MEGEKKSLYSPTHFADSHLAPREKHTMCLHGVAQARSIDFVTVARNVDI